jgi:hypothetical protein
MRVWTIGIGIPPMQTRKVLVYFVENAHIYDMICVHIKAT